MTSSRQVELQDLSSIRYRLHKPSTKNSSYSNSNDVTYQPTKTATTTTTTTTEQQKNSSTSNLGDDIISSQLRFVLTGDDPSLTLTPSASNSSSLISSTESFNSSTAKSHLPSETREELFRNCLSASTVDVDELRRLIWAHGTPDTLWARPLAWKLLLGYISPDRADWDTDLDVKRARYWKTVHDVTLDPSQKHIIGDHPLSNDQNSQWKEYFQDTQIRRLIQMDVKRTHPDLHRFIPLRNSLETILFVYAKTHPHIGYKQGMNELAAPFLIVFADVRNYDLSDVEADAYFCFESIMQEMIACYLPCINEDDDSGIARQLKEMQALLRIKDPILENHFQQLKIEATYYGIRWIRLWFSQEFCLPDLLTLWDSFLTAEIRLPWIRYVCVGMAIRLRDDFLTCNFAGCMKLLRNYPDCDVSELLRIADRLRTTNVVIKRAAKR